MSFGGVLFQDIYPFFDIIVDLSPTTANSSFIDTKTFQASRGFQFIFIFVVIDGWLALYIKFSY
jgi:hypothetical protein